MPGFLTPEHALLSFEREQRREGFCFIAGIDEAGRGPLAGPVVAAAVRFPFQAAIPEGVNDSKQLSGKEREELDGLLRAIPGIDFGIAVVDAAAIDRINILNATHLAMRQAVEQLKKVDCALVDGRPVKGLPVPSLAIVKGDAKSASIAAASILAKVYRDRLMIELDAVYPQYGFAEHKGYGTAQHLEALKKFGPCPAHRKSFGPVKAQLEAQSGKQMELF